MPSTTPTEPPAPAQSCLKILLVDDHELVRAALRDWLKAVFPRFDFVEAASGEEAIALAEEHRPCLAVMDIGLPGISGLEAARAILQKQAGTKVVMLSIHDEARYRDDAAQIGATAFVSKAELRGKLIPAILAALSVAEESRV